MCMSFILQQAQVDYERELRGVERLLCTLLCTCSDPSKDVRQPCRRCTAIIPLVCPPPPMIVRLF